MALIEVSSQTVDRLITIILGVVFVLLNLTTYGLLRKHYSDPSTGMLTIIILGLLLFLTVYGWLFTLHHVNERFGIIGVVE